MKRLISNQDYISELEAETKALRLIKDRAEAFIAVFTHPAADLEDLISLLDEYSTAVNKYKESFGR